MKKSKNIRAIMIATGTGARMCVQCSATTSYAAQEGTYY